ncbi:TRAP transporter substrate-binding protein [Variovorax sp. JS1663]|uniref:TRAP transporter substrate-binding protein n=1 Tax=Variovorax sp. JS1663 TaxID=1851577 RepID=UPI000B341558|nr:TRAP transporter substrate-binding protein [Variovorax sp. JS1663]OUL98593.1 ABC transporter substrate-binding protein [Variovorax sp. JS1663]
MNKIKLKALAASMLGALLVAGTTCTMAAEVKERTIKYAVIYDIKHPHGLGAQKFADLVAQRSGNKMKVKIYPNATLGGEVAIISSMQGGTVEMSAMATSQLVGVIKDFAALDLPFLFNSEKEVDRVVDGPVGKMFLDKMPEKGLIGLSWFEHGFRNLTNSRRPVTKLEDIQGLKIRVEQNAVAIDAWNALGANAVPMPFPELYTALEQKAVDGQENPYSTVDSAKFFEVQKYLSVTNHKYSPLILTLSKKFWDQLSGDEKKIIQDAATEAAVYQRKANRDLNEQYLQSLKKTGMQVNEVSAAEVERMRTKVQPVVDKYSRQIGGTLVKDLYGEIEKARKP